MGEPGFAAPICLRISRASGALYGCTIMSWESAVFSAGKLSFSLSMNFGWLPSGAGNLACPVSLSALIPSSSSRVGLLAFESLFEEEDMGPI